MSTDAQRVLGAGVLVALGGEEFRLFFDFEALEIIENEFGGLQPFAAALNQGWDGPRMKVCRVGLRAGLAHLDDPKLNGPQAIRRLTGYLIGPGGPASADRLVSSLIELWHQAIPPAPKAGKGLSRASGSHGSGSSLSPAKSSKSSAPESSAG